MTVRSRSAWWTRGGKRVFDTALSLAGLVMLSPMFLAVAAWVGLTLGSPILFRQRRPGLKGEPFTLYKFRTMTGGRDARGHLLPDAQRLPRSGRLLRRWSLDELPELVNVLRGDMSLVGPRPLLEEYLPLYSPRQARRHEVRPGLTGWAQVNGRNRLGWEEQLEMDAWYVDHVSFRLDLAIFVRTVARLVRPSDVSQPGHATREKFLGSS